VTHLLEAIEAFRGTLGVLGSQRLPALMATERLWQSMNAPEPRTEKPAEPRLKELRRRLLQLYSTDDGAADRRELRDAPWLLWDGTPPLASELPRLLDAVHVRAAEHQRTLSNLIEAWVFGFRNDDTTVLETGQRIGALLAVKTDRRLTLWQQAHRRLALFDAAKGLTKWRSCYCRDRRKWLRFWPQPA